MIIRKKNSISFEIPGGTKGFIYPSKKTDKQSFALVNSNGIYPEEGYSINEKCTETLFVVEGEIKISLDDKKHELLAGDIVVIEPGTKYTIKGKAKVIDFITPAWDKEQNKIIKD